MLKAKVENVIETTLCACGNHKEDVKALACPSCTRDLNYIIEKRTTDSGLIYTLKGKITLEEFLEYVKNNGIGSVGNCAICGERYIWGGNNPFPMVEDEDARCCSRCNDNVVRTRVEIIRQAINSNGGE